MPAPESRSAARCPGPWLVGLLALVACASNLPEPVQRTAAPQPAPAAEATAFTAPIAAASDVGLDELEASLAAYEQQLANNELRLQAMGVRLAQRAPTEAENAESKKDASVDDRFAQPPPAASAPGDVASKSAEQQAPGKARRTPTTATRKNAPARPQGGASGRATGYGGAPPAPEARAEEADQERGDRCGELCELASSTCDLEAKICELAARHVGEPRYDAVCQRADEDCRLASEACNRCSP